MKSSRSASSQAFPAKKTSKKAAHTPGCLLDGSTNSAEMVRSFLRHKKPLFIDRPKVSGSAVTAHFQLSSDQQVKEEVPEAEFFPAAEAMSEGR